MEKLSNNTFANSTNYTMRFFGRHATKGTNKFFVGYDFICFLFFYCLWVFFTALAVFLLKEHNKHRPESQKMTY